MAEQQKQAPQPAHVAAPPDPPPVKAPLGPAGASTDPAVQNLIAERETAVRNGDEDAVKALTERLAGLGAV